MATKKDLVEAYSFSRRRLVTAFVSGAPGGREVEPARPGRTIVGGLALAVLLVAGAAIAGVFSPTAPEDWTQRGLIISKETGAAYVITDDNGELHPVLNSTSAALILGADTEPTLIEQDTIDGQEIGSDIGILGAPASVPSPSRLINTGWTGCTADGAGVRMTVSETPDATPTPGTGLLVKSDGDLFAIVSGPSGTYSYAVPPQLGKNDKDNTYGLLRELGLPQTPVSVSREWLALFPVGAPLDLSSFELSGAGSPPSGSDQLASYDVGDLLVDASGDSFLVTDNGLLQLKPFAATVYANVMGPEGKLPKPIDVDRAPQTSDVDRTTLGTAQWPEDTVSEWSPDDQPCAELTTAEGAAPTIALAAAGPETAVGEIGGGDKDQAVDPGRGAFVLSGGFTATDQGSPFVVDSKGRANPLVGETAASQLGYDDVPVVVVPDTWIKMLSCGVNLSEAAALSPPAAEDRSGCAS